MTSYLYDEWRIREKERRAKERREKIRNIPKHIVMAIFEIVGFIKDSAIFYNRLSRRLSRRHLRRHSRRYSAQYARTTSDVQKLIATLSQVLAALIFFAVLVVGLNALALIV